ncbi:MULTISPECIES: phosphoribosylformylglycinamidine synthase subunit PurS [Marinococcus]|jgi:phosphoribosylformylglycinamidine synthase|uniref:phosphoribosylformylglycinamidine synthase subunit PurS n=1 Tax=Marinococcus TaxID=1370 RepID=UPI0003B77CE1|nr:MULTISPECIES: phosphoribosylformylglycinamidine synthase subunit PurS [Marinococcus]MDZ5783303.1 phosphoribosylformylglycinamidine synthase subunit PurS [Marinococcus luteus]
MVNVQVYVTLKEGVLDPQGSTIENALQTMGYHEVASVQTGKYIELEVEEGNNLEARIEEMCEKLLSNPVIEDYTYTIGKGVS